MSPVCVIWTANPTVSKLLADGGEQRNGTVFKDNDMEQGKTSGINLPNKGTVSSDLHLTATN